MGEITSYRDLHAWQVGMDTVTLTYELTSAFPGEERYGLVSQMRRAAVSIPSNVAEGKGVRQPRWSLRHIQTAIGSSLELETQLEVALRLSFVSRDRAKTLTDNLDRVQKLLYGMRRDRLSRVGAVAGASVIAVAILHLFA